MKRFGLAHTWYHNSTAPGRGQVVRSTTPPSGECVGGCRNKGRRVKDTGWCGRSSCKKAAARELGGL